MARKILVEIIGDDKSLQRALRNSEHSTSKFGRAFGKTAKGIGVASVAIGGAVAFGLKKSIDSANEHALALAQTQAVIKSTGGAANVTAKQMTNLADSIEKTTGVDDLAIQRGENLLATFTNIRNEAGKGNDIFTQSTRILADMSVALGQDTKSSALQLGKALNDPVKGVTALQRVGVSFTAKQKDQIKALVASGKSMQAQKLILRELQKEFGGSAVAAGKTLPGQLNILKARLDDVAQRIGEKLVPALTHVVEWVTAHWPQISHTFEVTFDAIGRAWEAAKPTFRELVADLRMVVEYVREHWPEISRVIARVVEDVRIIWAKIGPPIVAVIKIAVAEILPRLRAIGQVFKGVAEIIDGLLHGKWSEVWTGIKDVVVGAVKLMLSVLREAVKTFLVIGTALGRAFVKGLVAGLKGLGKLLLSLVIDPINKIIDAINAIKIPGFKVGVPGTGKSVGSPTIDPIPHIPRLAIAGVGAKETTVVHTTVNVDGKKVAEATTKHHTRKQKQTAAQRTGRSPGIVHG